MATDDFFRARLVGLVDPRHPLAVLARKMPWSEIEAALAPAFAHKDRNGRSVEGADMFGSTLSVSGAGVSAAGRPRLPIRLMVSLLYLKHAFNESDESLVQRWSENVVWQLFSGLEYYSTKLPCDPAQISRFRKILGEAGVEQLLKTTIETAVAIQAVKKTEFERVIVDTTDQEKAIAHPTDARLLDVARQIVVRHARRTGIALKMTYEREGKARKPYEFGVKASIAVTHGKGLVVQPAIGHLKAEHRIDRCWLKGAERNALQAVLCAAGFNIRWLLRAIAARAVKAAVTFVLLPFGLWSWLQATLSGRRAASKPGTKPETQITRDLEIRDHRSH
jgi:hypothetical protein